MKYTPKEIAELLKERPNQAHYIEWLVRRAVHEAVKAEREACAKACLAVGTNGEGAAGKIWAERCAQAVLAMGEE